MYPAGKITRILRDGGYMVKGNPLGNLGTIHIEDTEIEHFEYRDFSAMESF